MKLYIWQGHDVLSDCYGGMALAMAENEEQAKKLICEDLGCEDLCQDGTYGGRSAFLNRPPDEVSDTPMSIYVYA